MGGRRKSCVLVVDDDPRMLKSIGMLLGKLGFSTELYSSAETFLSDAALSRNPDSCLILDIHLSGMSGIELGNRLTKTGHAPAIIFITGNDNEGARKAALQQGCVAYLTKPFTAKVLVDAIDQALA